MSLCGPLFHHLLIIVWATCLFSIGIMSDSVFQTLVMFHAICVSNIHLWSYWCIEHTVFCACIGHVSIHAMAVVACSLYSVNTCSATFFLYSLNQAQFPHNAHHRLCSIFIIWYVQSQAITWETKTCVDMSKKWLKTPMLFLWAPWTYMMFVHVQGAFIRHYTVR